MMQRDEKENRGVQPKTAETHGETLFWGCHRHREKSFRNETCNVITNSMVLILDGNSEHVVQEGRRMCLFSGELTVLDLIKCLKQIK